MNRQQIILVATGLILLVGLYLFGETKPPASKEQNNLATGAGNNNEVDFNTLLSIFKQKLTPEQNQYLTGLENSVTRGDVKDQQINVYRQLARFWHDSANAFIPYAEYTAEAAKLENSEKSLTFAAHNFLGEIQGVNDPSLRAWMSSKAKELFERALALNPDNDSTMVGLGSCYFFGGAGNELPMKGIGLIREVLAKDSNNAYAHYMLGIGSLISGQLDKAIERFSKVVEVQPDNLEALLQLADTYEKEGDSTNARKSYIKFKETVVRLEKENKFRSTPEMMKVIDEKIKTLK